MKINKIISIGLIGLVGVVFHPLIASAVTTGNLNVGRCIEDVVKDMKDEKVANYLKGSGKDFLTLLGSSISYDGFQETMLEPWVDVIFRNQCQAIDLLALIDHRDAIENQMRDAYLTCNGEKLESTIPAYFKSNAEVYYVRHIVNWKVAANSPYGILSTNPDITETNRDSLYDDMYAKYVDGRILTKDNFPEFFLELEAKYKGRKETYKICPDTDWADVEAKWNEFKTFFTEDFGGTRQFGSSISQRWRKMVKTAANFRDIFKNPETFFLSHLEVNLNEINLTEGFREGLATVAEELLAEVNENNPFTGKRSITQGELLNEVANKQANLDTSTNIEKLSTKFATLYLMADNDVQSVVTELQQTDFIIRDTLTTLDSTKQCSGFINSSQR